jgi:hypothetical protein
MPDPDNNGSSSSLPHRYRSAAEILQQQVGAADDRSVLLDRREAHRQPGADQALAAISDELAQAAERARPIYEEFGSTPPSPLQGEDGRSYRLRVCDELRKHSPCHGNIRLRALSGLDEAAFSQIESEILADAAEAGKVFAPPGQLRERREYRADGSVHVTFAGDPKIWLARFMHPGRAVVKMRGPGGIEITPNRGFVGRTTR